MKPQRTGKRGSLLDLPVIVVVIFVLSIAAFFSVWLFQKLRAAGFFGISETSQQIGTTFNTYGVGVINNVILGVTVVLFLGAVILAYNLRDNPVYAAIAVIMFLFMLVVAPLLSNAYDQIQTNPELSETRDRMSFADNILSNLPLYLIGFGFLLIAVLYGFGRTGL